MKTKYSISLSGYTERKVLAQTLVPYVLFIKIPGTIHLAREERVRSNIWRLQGKVRRHMCKRCSPHSDIGLAIDQMSIRI
jgi:hypothetical protein